MPEKFTINASWDDQAKVWIATSEDVPGLCCEDKSLEGLIEVVTGLVPELLAANGIVTDARDIPLNVLAQRQTTIHRAA